MKQRRKQKTVTAIGAILAIVPDCQFLNAQFVGAQAEFSKVMSYWCPLLNVLSMTSVKVGNLNPCTTTNSLRIIFQKYGEIGDVYIPRDCFTKKPQGFAFVHFLDKRHAEDAVAVLDEIMVDGLVLRVHMAPPRYPLWQPWGKSCAQVLMTEPQPSGAKPIPISRHISLQPREVSINL